MHRRSTPQRTFLPVILVLSLAACGVDAPLQNTGNSEHAIISAEPARAGTFLAVGALAVPDRRNLNPAPCDFTLCTGTLISPTMVITAGHCLAGLAPSDLSFCIGDDLDGTVIELEIEEFHHHPRFVDEDPPGNVSAFEDIALVELRVGTAEIRPLRINSPQQATDWLTVGSMVRGIGFGQSVVGHSSTSGTKRMAEAPVREVGDFEFWVDTTDVSQKCHGDSGSPTLIDIDPSEREAWRVAGVASRTGADCTWGTIETRVDAYLSWIHKVADLPCGSGLADPCAEGVDEEGEFTATASTVPAGPPVITDRGCTVRVPQHEQRPLCMLLGFVLLALVCFRRR